MVPLSRIALLALSLLLVAGCGSNESASAPQDSPTVQASQQAEAQQVWTQDRQQAFRDALSRARSGKEEGPPSPPAASGNYSQGGGGEATQIGGGYSAPSGDGYSSPNGASGYPSNSAGTNPSGGSTVPSGRPNDVGSNGSDPMVGK